MTCCVIESEWLILSVLLYFVARATVNIDARKELANLKGIDIQW